MVSRQDERRLLIAFGTSLLAGSILAAFIQPDPTARKAAVAFGFFAISVLAGGYTF